MEYLYTLVLLSAFLIYAFFMISKQIKKEKAISLNNKGINVKENKQIEFNINKNFSVIYKGLLVIIIGYITYLIIPTLKNGELRLGYRGDYLFSILYSNDPVSFIFYIGFGLFVYIIILLSFLNLNYLEKFGVIIKNSGIFFLIGILIIKIKYLLPNIGPIYMFLILFIIVPILIYLTYKLNNTLKLKQKNYEKKL